MILSVINKYQISPCVCGNGAHLYVNLFDEMMPGFSGHVVPVFDPLTFPYLCLGHGATGPATQPSAPSSAGAGVRGAGNSQQTMVGSSSAAGGGSQGIVGGGRLFSLTSGGASSSSVAAGESLALYKSASCLTSVQTRGE